VLQNFSHGNNISNTSPKSAAEIQQQQQQQQQ